jgi:ATP/maltotriose-dependent transcriptional regulator MalT
VQDGKRQLDPGLKRARVAGTAGAWADAYARLAALDRKRPLSPADLERLADAAYLTGRSDVFLRARERAHHAFTEAGDLSGAARCAFWIGFLLAGRGEIGPATGWFARARRLVERQSEDCVERGYLLVARAEQQLASGEHEAGLATAQAAAQVAESFAEPDLLALALHLQGRALLGRERVEEGLALLDEAMVGVTAGELSAPVTGLIYCSMIGACRRVFALDRSRIWTQALNEWCERQPDLIAYTGQCRVYRAEIMQLRGAWHEALQEVERALARAAASDEPGVAAVASYQSGELYRLLGEHDAAEQAFREASRLGRPPQPGLALLRLAQGRTAAAAAAVRNALAETTDALQRARLLPAHIEIMIANRDVEAARAACGELRDSVAVCRSALLQAQLDSACGAVELAEGRHAAALATLRRAWHGWRGLGEPYGAACATALVARAAELLGDPETAALERESARATFEQLGVAWDLTRIDGAPARPAARKSGLTRRELQVLALLADGRTNKAIAGELSISERTVDRHVSNIFAKLGVSTRAAATAYVYEHDLR